MAIADDDWTHGGQTSTGRSDGPPGVSGAGDEEDVRNVGTMTLGGCRMKKRRRLVEMMSRHEEMQNETSTDA